MVCIYNNYTLKSLSGMNATVLINGKIWKGYETSRTSCFYSAVRSHSVADRIGFLHPISRHADK